MPLGYSHLDQPFVTAMAMANGACLTNNTPHQVNRQAASKEPHLNIDHNAAHHPTNVPVLWDVASSEAELRGDTTADK